MRNKSKYELYSVTSVTNSDDQEKSNRLHLVLQRFDSVTESLGAKTSCLHIQIKNYTTHIA